MNPRQHQNNYFSNLTNPFFSSTAKIWEKRQQHVPCSNFHQKFKIFKIGKTFGFVTQQILTVYGSMLLRYDKQNSPVTHSVCNINNLYFGAFVTHNKHPYLIKLGNYCEFTDIYLDNLENYQRLIALLRPYVIQINFNFQFELIKPIGKGSFAEVLLARNNNSKRLFAVKRIHKMSEQQTPTSKEVNHQKNILIALQSEYCCRFQQMFQDSLYFCLVLEYVPGPTLMELIHTNQIQNLLSTSQIKILLKNILQCLQHLHNKNIIWRDLKPQNIIVNPSTLKPKLIDMGIAILSNKQTNSQQFNRSGTVGYMAPEVMNSFFGRTTKVRFDQKVDMFAFGILSHMLMLGVNPLRGKDYDQTLKNNKNIKQISIDHLNLSKIYGTYASKLLSGLLCFSPFNRFSVNQAIVHPFFTQIDKQITCSTQESNSSSNLSLKNSAEFVLLSPRRNKNSY